MTRARHSVPRHPILRRFRILPLTIFAMALLLGQKCFQLTGAAITGFTGEAAAAETAPGTSPAAARPPAAPNWDDTQPPPAICPPENTVDPGEIGILSALRQRALALDAREQGLNRKQALVDAAERSLASQLAGLKAVEDRLNAYSENQSQADEARWQALVATYSAMDPQAAAGIFNGLDPNVLLPVLTRMNSRKSAPILAAMDPDKARQATELLAGQSPEAMLGAASPLGQ